MWSKFLQKNVAIEDIAIDIFAKYDCDRISKWRDWDRYFAEEDFAINFFAKEDIAIDIFAKEDIAIEVFAKEDIAVNIFAKEGCD